MYLQTKYTLVKAEKKVDEKCGKGYKVGKRGSMKCFCRVMQDI